MNLPTVVAYLDDLEILCYSINITTGNKSVAFEYPFTNKRTIQELGPKQAVIEVKCCVEGNTLTEYQSRRDQLLLKTSNTPGRKTLITPFGKIFYGYIVGDVTIDEEQSSLYKTELSFKFIEATENNLQDGIFYSDDYAKYTSSTALQEIPTLEIDYYQNLLPIASQESFLFRIFLNQLFQEFTRFIARLSTNVELDKDIIRSTNAYVNNVDLYLTKPEAIASGIAPIFINLIIDFKSNPNYLYKEVKLLFDSLTIPYASGMENLVALQVKSQFIYAVFSFVTLAQLAIDYEYDFTNDVDSVILDLTSIYNNIYTGYEFLSNNTLSQVTDVYTATISALLNKKQDLYSIKSTSESIEEGYTPFLYSLYTNDDLYDDVLSINPLITNLTDLPSLNILE